MATRIAPSLLKKGFPCPGYLLEVVPVMSLPLLVAALLDLLYLILLPFFLQKDEARASDEGGLASYRGCISSLWERGGRRGVLCFLHYLGLHLFVPLLGLGFFLRSDINFLVVILSMVLSLQILQRVYPGVLLSGEESAGDRGETEIH